MAPTSGRLVQYEICFLGIDNLCFLFRGAGDLGWEEQVLNSSQIGD